MFETLKGNIWSKVFSHLNAAECTSASVSSTVPFWRQATFKQFTDSIVGKTEYSGYDLANTVVFAQYDCFEISPGWRNLYGSKFFVVSVQMTFESAC